METIKTIEIIEAVLAVIGIASLILTFIRVIWSFCSSGLEWIDNITITEEPYTDDDTDKGMGIYPTVYKCTEDRNSKYLTSTMICPQSTIIRNLKIKKFAEKSITKRKLKYRTVKKVKNVTPQFPLCIVAERGEAIAPYMVEWRIDYGGKAQYFFYENMRDGNNNRIGIEYTFSFFSKLRKLLDLK